MKYLILSIFIVSSFATKSFNDIENTDVNQMFVSEEETCFSFVIGFNEDCSAPGAGVIHKECGVDLTMHDAIIRANCWADQHYSDCDNLQAMHLSYNLRKPSN